MTDEEVWTEDLPQPRSHRSVQVVLVLLVLGAAAAIGVRLAGSGSSDPRAAPTAVPTDAPSSKSTVAFRPPPDCPRATDGQFACNTYTTAQRGVVRAIRSLDPAIGIDEAITQMLRPTGPEAVHGLWSREVTGHAGALQVRIAIARQDAVTGASAASTVTLAVPGYVLAIGEQGHYGVQVMLRGAGRHPAAALLTRLATLAADHRLVRPQVAAGGTMAG